MFGKCLGVTIKLPLPRLQYEEAMLRYGSDKPDLRYGMKLIDVTDLARQSELKVFLDAINPPSPPLGKGGLGGVVKAICLPGQLPGGGVQPCLLDEELGIQLSQCPALHPDSDHVAACARELCKRIVECRDARPVRLRAGARPGVTGSDRGLQGVRSTRAALLR